jgi:hypothetical protein
VFQSATEQGSADLPSGWMSQALADLVLSALSRDEVGKAAYQLSQMLDVLGNLIK